MLWWPCNPWTFNGVSLISRRNLVIVIEWSTFLFKMKSIIRSCTSATHWILSHVVIHVTFEQNILSHYCTLSINYFLRLWWLWNKDSSSFSLHVCRGTRPAFMASSVEDFQASSLTVRWKARADNGGSLITGYRMIIKGDTRERQCEDHWSWYNKSHFWGSGERYKLRNENVCKECWVWIYQTDIYFFFWKIWR